MATSNGGGGGAEAEAEGEVEDGVIMFVPLFLSSLLPFVNTSNWHSLLGQVISREKNHHLPLVKRVAPSEAVPGFSNGMTISFILIFRSVIFSL